MTLSDEEGAALEGLGPITAVSCAGQGGEASDMVLGKNKAVRLGKEGWTQQEHSELGTVSSWRARRAQTTRTREKAVQ